MLRGGRPNNSALFGGESCRSGRLLLLQGCWPASRGSPSSFEPAVRDFFKKWEECNFSTHFTNIALGRFILAPLCFLIWPLALLAVRHTSYMAPQTRIPKLPLRHEMSPLRARKDHWDEIFGIGTKVEDGLIKSKYDILVTRLGYCNKCHNKGHLC